MTADFITKRPHKKSRGGCTTCKARKVKCDEAQPECGYCAKRNFSCLYTPKPSKPRPSFCHSSSSVGASSQASLSGEESPDASESCELVAAPFPTIPTSSGNLSIKDLRLVHQWSMFTAASCVVGDGATDTLKFAVPQLAFENGFLLNAMLGIASLHEERQSSSLGLVRKQTYLYRFKALSGFRQALAYIKPGTNMYEAALITSILLVVLYSENDNSSLEDGELVVVNWLILYRGLSAIISMASFDDIRGLSVWPIFQRERTELKLPPVVPKVLIDMLQEVHPLDPDFPMLESWCKTLDALGLLYGSLRQDGLSEALYVRIISWPSYSNQDFTNCAREKRPRVLIILTYYLAFTKLANNIWWLQGIADREITAIVKMLGPEWLPFMEVPLFVTQMRDNQEIARLLMA